jgi:hypothetical protein
VSVPHDNCYNRRVLGWQHKNVGRLVWRRPFRWARCCRLSMPHLSLLDLELQTLKAQDRQTSFGAILSVFVRSRVAIGVTLEQLVSLAVARRKYRLANTYPRQTGGPAPVAAILWAKVSRVVNRRLSCNLGDLANLEPSEGTSSKFHWLLASSSL